MNKASGWLVAFVSLLCITLALLLVVLLSPHGNLGLSNSTESSNTRVTLIVLIFGAAVAGSVFVGFAALGWEERGIDDRSLLLTPRIVGLGCLYAYLDIQGARAYDVLLHGLHNPRWIALYGPVVSTLATVLLIGFLTSKAWEYAVILYVNRGWSRSRIVVVFSIVTFFVGVFLWASLRLGGTGV